MRLKASFTVYDRFQGNAGFIVYFVGLLKAPLGLADVWLKAVIRDRSPMPWSQIQTNYWTVLKAISGQPQLLQVQDHHILDWSDILFGNKPLETGKDLQ